MIQTVFPASSLNGTVFIPPDKSIAHRSALFAALAEGTSGISNYSLAADPQTTLNCIRQLGVRVEADGPNVRVYGKGRFALETPSGEVDCGNSGTTMRLLSGIVAGSGMEATLTGDHSLTNRTMKRILDPLRMMGAPVSAREGMYAPLRFSKHGGLKSLNYELPIASAQLKSCILLAGLFSSEETTVIEKMESRNHTEELLKLRTDRRNGCKVIYSSSASLVPLQNYAVPGDFSASAFWMVAGSIHDDAHIILPAVGINPSRTAVLNILQRMGADIKLHDQRKQGNEPIADIEIRKAGLKAITLSPSDIPNCIDELPVLAVAMLFAEGRSEFRKASELRHKECDRLSAMAGMLQKVNAEFTEHADGLTIFGNPEFTSQGARFESLHDHRIAMSAAVLASKCSSASVVEDAECTAISYPDFFKDLEKIRID
ncbi:MAG: 3-phosphoshikimate 1-carboxyvinyltransferase [Balneolales bacterium]